MKNHTSTIASILLSLALNSNAQIYQWSGNGHYYEPVATTTNISWIAASNAAVAAGGYLATITSSDENDFVYSLIVTNDEVWQTNPGGPLGPWIGGFQTNGSSEPAGGWTWVTGEPFSYSNWRNGEPNNSGGDENYLEFIGNGSVKTAQWNDLPNDGPPIYNGYIYGVNGYIIEFDSAPPPIVSIFTAVEINWLALTNVSYQVQWSSDLGSTNWTNLGASVQGASTNTSVFDSTRYSSKRFYRVEVSP